MHELLAKVLEDRQLSKAGQLFNISDWDIVADLHTALAQLKEIFNSDTYALDQNNQSVVEICLARITSAVRETFSIETYAPGLVDMLESCLRHNLTPVVIGNMSKEDNDTPHSKIASDLLSCLFLHYGSKSVMAVSIPVAVKVLQKGNKDLIRNTSSYLSLAAIQNARMLSQYALQIINSISSGNYSLVRVIPQVYGEHREPFHAHLASLISVLGDCDSAEKLSLLQLCTMIANSQPEMLVPHVSQLRSCLVSPHTCSSVLTIYLALVTNGQASALSSQLPALRKAAEGKFSNSNHIANMAKITGAIGILNKENAREGVCNLMLQIHKVDSSTQSVILTQIERIAENYPLCVQPHLETIAGFAESGLLRSAYIRIRDLCSDDDTIRNSLKNLSSSEKITVIPITADSPKPERTVPPSSTVASLNSGTTTTFAITGRAIASVSRNSKSNLSKPKSRSFASLSSSRRHLSTSPSCQRPTAPGATNFRDYSVSGVSLTIQRPPPPYKRPERHSPLALGQSAGVLPQLQMDVKGRIRPNTHRPIAPWLNNNSVDTASHLVTTFNVQPDTITQRTGSGSTLIIEEQQPVMANPEPNATVLSVNEQNSSNSITVTSPNNRNSTPEMAERINTIARTMNNALLQPNPPPINDAVRQFCQKHRKKIREYMSDIGAKYPIPTQCTVEESGHKHRMRVYFGCQERADHCLYSESLFAFKTRLPSVWLHLMFLHLQAQQTGDMLGQNSEQVKKLKRCWECLPGFITKNGPFSALVTSAFPGAKDQQQLFKELQSSGYLDSFAYNANKSKWSCFACNHPDKVKNFLNQEPNNPVIEGQLKEKRGRWKFFKRWQTKYFTLSSAALCYRDEFCEESSVPNQRPSIDLRSIRSVKSVSKRKSRRTLPKAFEIFTNDQTSYILKAKDQNDAEAWFQCLQIAVAQAQREVIVSAL